MGSKWVFKEKVDETGEVIRFKEQVVAQGFSQQMGIDYTETFAPLLRFTTLRTLLALAAEHEWIIEHMDIKTAFLKGILEEEVFKKPPPGLHVSDDMVCGLKKSIYGLKQSPQAWNHRLHLYLLSPDFPQSNADHDVYFHATLRVILSVYVDNILILGQMNKNIMLIQKQLGSEFAIEDLGDVK